MIVVPISNLAASRDTGAGVRMSANAPEFVPRSAVPGRPPAWPAPSAEGDGRFGERYQPWEQSARLQAQAGKVLEALSHYETYRGEDPWWSRKFWAWVEQADRAEPLLHDLSVALRRHGWSGPGTISAVPAAFRTALDVAQEQRGS